MVKFLSIGADLHQFLSFLKNFPLKICQDPLVGRDPSVEKVLYGLGFQEQGPSRIRFWIKFYLKVHIIDISTMPAFANLLVLNLFNTFIV